MVAYGQPVITPHIVAGGPAGTFTVDIEVTVDPNDAWTAGGISATAVNGASHLYATDPNTADNQATAPDTGNGGRFVSFVSLPRPQGANARFRNPGAASIAGAFDPVGAIPTLDAGLFNVAFLEFPPTGTQGSGFNARITLDISGTGFAAGDLSLSPTDSASAISRVLVAQATQNFSSPLTEMTFFIVPEPASLALLVLGGLVAFRRR